MTKRDGSDRKGEREMRREKTFFKADLHVHSTFSEVEKGILKRIIPSESYTLPSEIYRIARKRGMDFVTITDHNSIRGALEIAHLPGVFISEEVTATFPEDGCKVHIIVLDINENQHKEIQMLRENIYELV
ncbi:PHP domain-containing protein, partial [Candidatus Aerophobetes bacterium]|nr:PHP domain-containing protein [Candidatus Aerophobetes bacterium]